MSPATYVMWQMNRGQPVWALISAVRSCEAPFLHMKLGKELMAWQMAGETWYEVLIIGDCVTFFEVSANFSLKVEVEHNV